MQKKSQKCLFFGRVELSDRAVWPVIETGKLKYCGMNSLDRGLYGRIIGAITELIASNSYCDCNGSDG